MSVPAECGYLELSILRDPGGGDLRQPFFSVAVDGVKNSEEIPAGGWIRPLPAGRHVVEHYQYGTPESDGSDPRIEIDIRPGQVTSVVLWYSVKSRRFERVGWPGSVQFRHPSYQRQSGSWFWIVVMSMFTVVAVVSNTALAIAGEFALNADSLLRLLWAALLCGPGWYFAVSYRSRCRTNSLVLDQRGVSYHLPGAEGSVGWHELRSVTVEPDGKRALVLGSADGQVELKLRGLQPDAETLRHAFVAYSGGRVPVA